MGKNSDCDHKSCNHFNEFVEHCVKFMEEHGIAPPDGLEMMAELGKRAVTSLVKRGKLHGIVKEMADGTTIVCAGDVPADVDSHLNKLIDKVRHAVDNMAETPTDPRVPPGTKPGQA